MNELKVFAYGENEVRTIEKDGEIWWVAKDVCDVFGETNHHRAKRDLDKDEVGVTNVPHPQSPEKTIGVSIVNESGLYSLLFAMQPEKARGVTDEYVASRQAKLRQFKRWVTHEVLPSIRKTGGYGKAEEAAALAISAALAEFTASLPRIIEAAAQTRTGGLTEAERREAEHWKRIIGDWREFRMHLPDKETADKAYIAGVNERFPGYQLTRGRLYRKWTDYSRYGESGLVDRRGKHGNQRYCRKTITINAD